VDCPLAPQKKNSFNLIHQCHYNYSHQMLRLSFTYIKFNLGRDLERSALRNHYADDPLTAFGEGEGKEWKGTTEGKMRGRESGNGRGQGREKVGKGRGMFWFLIFPACAPDYGLLRSLTCSLHFKYKKSLVSYTFRHCMHC